MSAATAAIRANLETELLNASTRLTELDAVPIGQRPFVTYSDQGRSVSWAELRAALEEKFTEIETRLKGLQALEGPFQVEDAGPGYW